LCFTRWDEKTRSHLHMFKKNLTHRYFKFSSSICTSWINLWIFFLFFGPVRFTSVQLTSSHLFLLPGAATSLTDVVTLSLHVTLFFIELRWARCPHFIAVLTSSSDNTLSRRLLAQVKTEVLNSHHHRRLSSPDRLTPTLHCYKNIILILITLSTL
jgi:hypothetical protein